jgi:hypothetical protein
MVRSGLCPERAGKFSCPVCNQYINGILGSSAFQRGAVHAVQTAFRPRANSLCAACRFWGRKLPFGVEFYPGTNRGTSKTPNKSLLIWLPGVVRYRSRVVNKQFLISRDPLRRLVGPVVSPHLSKPARGCLRSVERVPQRHNRRHFRSSHSQMSHSVAQGSQNMHIQNCALALPRYPFPNRNPVDTDA